MTPCCCCSGILLAVIVCSFSTISRPCIDLICKGQVTIKHSLTLQALLFAVSRSHFRALWVWIEPSSTPESPESGKVTKVILNLLLLAFISYNMYMNIIKLAKLSEYFCFFSRKRHATFEIEVNTYQKHGHRTHIAGAQCPISRPQKT